LLRIPILGSVSLRVAVSIATAAVALYVLLWLGWSQHWQWLTAIDNAALTPLHDFGVAHPAWVRWWNLFSNTFGPNCFRLVGVIAVVVAALRRNLRAVLMVLIAIYLSGIVAQLAKNLADRPRPSSALVGAPSSSFPSGHAVGVMVGVLVLLTLFWDMLGPRSRIASATLGAILVCAVGASRVVLNVHNPSDVLAGWALGYLWFCLCWFLIRPRPLNAWVADERPAAPGIDR
jgi:membrane-associated phospholipid phosphatase